ncbi:MAG: FKBP-type peptidyl-prolyl cis-trans isomerase [Thermoproteales archaeon]|nr:FKBP-type peptidyl-prolyl cis-trans isomerase [Thermoproteales archaeon]
MRSLPLKPGDVVLLDYTLSLKDDGRVVETTSEEVAREAGIYREDAEYGPRLVVLGSGELPSGLEEVLKEMEEGEEKEVVLPPEKAFGKRDPGKVRVLPARELSARGIVPRVGMEVEVRGERGVVLSVGSGRVIIDFNHPLAGKEVVYKVKLVKVLRAPEERVKGFLEKWLGRLEGAEVRVENGEAVLELPFRLLHSRELVRALEAFASDVEKHVKEVTRIKLVSTILEREVKEKETPSAQAATP